MDILDRLDRLKYELGYTTEVGDAPFLIRVDAIELEAKIIAWTKVLEPMVRVKVHADIPPEFKYMDKRHTLPAIAARIEYDLQKQPEIKALRNARAGIQDRLENARELAQITPKKIAREELLIKAEAQVLALDLVADFKYEYECRLNFDKPLIPGEVHSEPINMMGSGRVYERAPQGPHIPKNEFQTARDIIPDQYYGIFNENNWAIGDIYTSETLVKYFRQGNVMFQGHYFDFVDPATFIPQPMPTEEEMANDPEYIKPWD